MTLRVGIIGCGLIGIKRAMYINALGNLKSICDKSEKRIKNFIKITNKKNLDIYTDYKKLLNDSKLNVVIISTTHNILSDIAIEAIKKNKHVFVEKPGGISLTKLNYIKTLAKKNNIKVKVGFNHRYHPAFLKIKELLKEKKKLGKIISIRAVYGHGGRIGYENEWRMNPKLSGGGQLLDQGSHLLDLSYMLLGKLKLEKAILKSYFWTKKVEDNVYLILSDKKEATVFLHTSCTEWKNKFLFEIFFENAKLEVNGLGRSYGKEKLIFYMMKKQMGPPNIKEYIFPQKDLSWKKELKDFNRDIINNLKPIPGIDEAITNLKTIKEIYKKC